LFDQLYLKIIEEWLMSFSAKKGPLVTTPQIEPMLVERTARFPIDSTSDDLAQRPKRPPL